MALREEADALYGTFRVHPGTDGDKALHMVNEGVLTGLSIEALPTRDRADETESSTASRRTWTRSLCAVEVRTPTRWCWRSGKPPSRTTLPSRNPTSPNQTPRSTQPSPDWGSAR